MHLQGESAKRRGFTAKLGRLHEPVGENPSDHATGVKTEQGQKQSPFEFGRDSHAAEKLSMVSPAASLTQIAAPKRSAQCWTISLEANQPTLVKASATAQL